ncbi:MAG: NAD-dependent epimerase/dehydratase family protein [Kouleothrix sp.]|jgi:nucleoside-diphosphate-sugar epimerase|nr:NAD-dependent epimerase/dehydratase family protein [Kouleothrix sp.]
MKYFVTGATGFVGGRVARQLAEAGHEVVAVVRSPAKATDLAALGITVVRGDVTDKESMRAPMRGVDGVYHIAGWYKIGARDPREGQAINVQGTRNVLELMREHAIPKGVYTSTLAINSDTHGQVADETYRFNGSHLSIYDRTKAAAHALADQMIAAGLPLVIVMPGLIYGPGDTSSVRTTLIQYLQRRLPLLPKQTAYSWAHVDDIAQGHIQAMEQGRSGESYIIAGPTHTLIEAIELAERITGIAAPRLRAAPGALKAMAALMGLVERVVPVPASYTAEYLRVSAGATYIGSNAKARRELGYRPRPLAEGLAATLLHEMALLGMAAPPAAG